MLDAMAKIRYGAKTRFELFRRLLSVTREVAWSAGRSDCTVAKDDRAPVESEAICLTILVAGAGIGAFSRSMEVL